MSDNHENDIDGYSSYNPFYYETSTTAFPFFGGDYTQQQGSSSSYDLSNSSSSFMSFTECLQGSASDYNTLSGAFDHISEAIINDTDNFKDIHHQPPPDPPPTAAAANENSTRTAISCVSSSSSEAAGGGGGVELLEDQSSKSNSTTTTKGCENDQDDKSKKLYVLSTLYIFFLFFF